MRPFEFLAKPCSVAYDKYARSQELAKKRQNLIKILPFWGDLIFKHPNGCLFISIPCTRFTSFRAKIWGPRGILCTRGEKAHTSKRVSIIACNNVISKVQCAPRTLGFSEPRKKRQKSIKFSPFCGRVVKPAFLWRDYLYQKCFIPLCFSQRICVKVIYKYRTTIKPPTHIFKTIPRKKTVYCYIARVSC